MTETGSPLGSISWKPVIGHPLSTRRVQGSDNVERSMSPHRCLRAPESLARAARGSLHRRWQARLPAPEFWRISARERRCILCFFPASCFPRCPRKYFQVAAIEKRQSDDPTDPDKPDRRIAAEQLGSKGGPNQRVQVVAEVSGSAAKVDELHPDGPSPEKLPLSRGREVQMA
jgi:hypothetical protein